MALIDLGFAQATVPDLLRIFTVFFFGWVAIRDIKTRRVSNSVWLPVYALGLALIAWELYYVLQDEFVLHYVIPVAISIGVVIPLGWLLWMFGSFGGADAKAIFALALLFPVAPRLFLESGQMFPLVVSSFENFSLAVLMNAVLLMLLYSVYFFVRNVVRSDIHRLMVYGRQYPISNVPMINGKLLDQPHGRSKGGLDLDVLRMYLQWRGIALDELRVYGTGIRRCLPKEEYKQDVDDGRVTQEPHIDPEMPMEERVASTRVEKWEQNAKSASFVEYVDDPWAVDEFAEEIGGLPYGVTEDELRKGLDVVSDLERDQVFITPGIPFLVPIFGGLLIGLVYGDLFFSGFSTVVGLF